nr:hypothetical protein [Tanacetum cinerariifolium]
MALTFANTHNMITCLTKSDASEGFDQIIDFLNASSIKYALTVNDVTRLQALVDKKKVIITEATIREALRLDDVKSIDCLPNEEIFTELSRMSLVRNVDSSTKFYMYPRFLKLMIRAQVGDLSSHFIKYSSPALTQKVFANMRRVGKEFSGVDTPLFEGMVVAQKDDDVADEGRIIANIDADEDVTLKDVAVVAKDVAVVEKDAEIKENTDDDEVDATITAATTLITAAAITTTPSAARRRKRVVIRDPEETTTPSIIIHSEPKSKDKGKEILVEESKPLKKQALIEQDKAFTREQMEEEDSKALKRASESQAEKASKKQKLDEEVPVVDYEIYTENNKPYYKIIRADRSLQLFLSFLSLLWNFDREDLEVLWQLVKERFASSKPKNFSDDFLLTTLTYIFEKHDVQAQVWKNQMSVHGLAKVKNWRLLESCGVHIITFTTTQMILLVERRYPLTRFTLDQMLNNVRLEVEEESKVSLEQLRFVRQQQHEGFRPE